jgi:hypothetical protein
LPAASISASVREPPPALLPRPAALKSLSAMSWWIQAAAATCGVVSVARKVFSPEPEFWTTDQG